MNMGMADEEFHEKSARTQRELEARRGMPDEHTEALRLIEDWLPPRDMTSIPDQPIKPAQANALHDAVRTVRARIRKLEEANSRLSTQVDELENAESRLLAEQDKLREALEQIAEHHEPNTATACNELARAALTDTNQEP